MDYQKIPASETLFFSPSSLGIQQKAVRMPGERLQVLSEEVFLRCWPLQRALERPHCLYYCFPQAEIGLCQATSPLHLLLTPLESWSFTISAEEGLKTLKEAAGTSFENCRGASHSRTRQTPFLKITTTQTLSLPTSATTSLQTLQ